MLSIKSKQKLKLEIKQINWNKNKLIEIKNTLPVKKILHR